MKEISVLHKAGENDTCEAGYNNTREACRPQSRQAVFFNVEVNKNAENFTALRKTAIISQAENMLKMLRLAEK